MPQVGGYKFTKVLMDGGSSINILYYETFRRMGLTNKNIKPSNTVFHGVVPSKSAYTTKKDTSVAFWAERIFFCHTYDTSMTIIVTKPGIIIDVGGSYFYDKKS